MDEKAYQTIAATPNTTPALENLVERLKYHESEVMTLRRHIALENKLAEIKQKLDDLRYI